MQKSHSILLPSLAGLALLSSCANPHFFPRSRPLFAGFNDQQVPGTMRSALDQAKLDFQLARRGKPPLYAKFVGTLPYSMSKVYQGNGYEITMVDDSSFAGHALGPEIVIRPEITGGELFKYDEIDEIRG